MGLKKCPECGELINDELSSCSNCGYPFDGTEERVEANDMSADEVPISEKENEEISNSTMEVSNEVDEMEAVQEEIVQEEKMSEDLLDKKIEEDEKIETESTQRSSDSDDKVLNKQKIQKIGIGLGIGLAAIFIAVVGYVNSDFAKYKKAAINYKNKNYKVAAEQYKELGEYKDSKQMYKTSVHLDAVQKDKTAPTISYPEVTIEEGDSFDSETFVKNRVKAEDDVTANVNCMMVSTDVDNNIAGNYTISVIATDEAGNTQSEDIPIQVKKKCNLENLKASAQSIYSDGKIPGLYNIEYNEEDKSLYIYIMNDGISEGAAWAKVNTSMKNTWDEMVDTLVKVSNRMYNKILNDGYTEVKAVWINLLNDSNPDKILVSCMNGVKLYDATD